MKKKIMFINSSWQENYTQQVIDGIKAFSDHHDLEIHIFNAYGETVEYYTKETEIFYLPNVSNYDGALVMLNALENETYMDYFSKECAKYDIPVVSIDRNDPNCAYCGIDNYSSEYAVVEHLIEEHGCKKLHFIGGPEEHADTKERVKAFTDCLKAHGLEPVGIDYAGYMRSSGKAAYQKIKEEGKGLAEAYVFANDFAAIGFSTAAREDDLIAPRDYLFTGFDHMDVGKKHIPSLTTVDRNLYELGYCSIEHLLNLISGTTKEKSRFVTGKLVHGGSCGCARESDLQEQYLELSRLTEVRENNESLLRRTRELVCGNNSFEELQKEAILCRDKYGLEEIMLGINSSLVEESNDVRVGYDDQIDTYIVGSNDVAKLNRSEELICDAFRREGENIYLFATMHCKERTLGYSVFRYRPELMELLFHRTMNESMSMAVENVKQALILNRMNQKLECLYVQDSLTGLYNRFGYNSFSGQCFRNNKGRIYIVFIDMDNLKKMNDQYGHDAGDAALKGIAAGIKAVFTDTDIKVRMGGDEFLVMGPFTCEEDLIKKEQAMDEFLAKYSEENQLPIKLEVSMGHSYNDMELEATGLGSLLQDADAHMYQHKQAKKKSRVD